MISRNDNSNGVINLDYLLNLSKGNTPFVREMVATFLEENPKEIDLLEKAILARNFEAVRQAAHAMRSSIPFVGLDKVIESEVYEIEKIAGGTPDIQRIEHLFAAVKVVCDKAREELYAVEIPVSADRTEVR